MSNSENDCECPMCQSNNISDNVMEGDRFIEGLWECKDCGYQSNWGDF